MLHDVPLLIQQEAFVDSKRALEWGQGKAGLFLIYNPVLKYPKTAAPTSPIKCLWDRKKKCGHTG